MRQQTPAVAFLIPVLRILNIQLARASENKWVHIAIALKQFAVHFFHFPRRPHLDLIFIGPYAAHIVF